MALADAGAGANKKPRQLALSGFDVDGADGETQRASKHKAFRLFGEFLFFCRSCATLLL